MGTCNLLLFTQEKCDNEKVMYISRRLYRKNPDFSKERLALHCRRGLMFVC